LRRENPKGVEISGREGSRDEINQQQEGKDNGAEKKARQKKRAC